MGALDMTTPARVAASLRQIAAGVDSSASPDRGAVRSDLRRVLFALTREDRVRRIAADMVRLAQDEIELTSWDLDEGKDVDSAFGFAKKQTEDEKIVPALNSLRKDVDNFIDEIKSPGAGQKRDDASEEDVVTSAPKRRDIK
jgi:hypothetical protein